MAKKGVLGNGTDVWVLHGVAPTFVLTKMSCIAELLFGDDSAAEVDNTCLAEREVRTNDYGLVTPGDGSFKINTDPKNATHVIILDLADKKELVGIYAGWSDGTEAPTFDADTGVVTLPESRSWSWCQAILRKNSVVIGLDALNNHTVPFKRQSKVYDELKVSP